MENQILIIENEYYSVKMAFEAANLLAFRNELIYHNISKAQDIKYERLMEYSLIFIDISLAQKSDLDGSGIIESFKTYNIELLKRVVIITGNNKIKDEMKKRELDCFGIDIIMKPIGFQEIIDVINKKRLLV